MLRILLFILCLGVPAAADTVIDMPLPPVPVPSPGTTTYEARGDVSAPLPPGALALARWAGGRDAPRLTWYTAPRRAAGSSWWWSSSWAGNWWWSGSCRPFLADRHVRHHRPDPPPAAMRRSPWASPPTTFRTSREPR